MSKRRSMDRPSKTSPFDGLSPAESLHKLKDHCHESYLGEECRALFEHLHDAIEATEHAARIRKQPFNPDGSRRDRRAADKINQLNEERLLEARIWSRWRFDGPPTGEESTLWATLVGIQVPLFDSRHKGGWGHIDLLGIDKAGGPVIVELKKGESTEVPLRAVLEVVSYAIALRKNWKRFAEELRRQLTKTRYRPCAKDAPFPCVVLAPSLYWQRWVPDGKLGKAFGELLAALKGRGYPVTFGRVNDVSAEVCPFPIVWG